MKLVCREGETELRPISLPITGHGRLSCCRETDNILAILTIESDLELILEELMKFAGTLVAHLWLLRIRRP